MNGAAPTPIAVPAGPDPLAALRDWHLPEPVAWWPPAPGWWLAAALILGLGVSALLWWRIRRRRTAPARAALAELSALRSRFAQGMDGRRFAGQVSALLRRLALVRYPRGQVAGLAGPQWLAFLDRTGGGGGFTQGPGRVLCELPYRSGGPSDPAAGWEPAGLADLAARWIRTHWAPRA